MIFWPEHAEDIGSVYLLNQIFDSISDLDIEKDMTPYLYHSLCVCISSYSIDKKIAHCCFCIDRIKNKKRIARSSCWMYYWKHTYFFFLPNHEILSNALQIPTIDSSSDEGLKLNQLVGQITFENVHFSYPSRKEVQVCILFVWILLLLL